MRRYHLAAVSVFVVVSISACAVNKQQRAINNARLAIEATTIAANAADKVVVKMYGDKPAEDTDSYCKNKIAALVFKQTRITLTQALDSILLWERALATYKAKKGAGNETSADWIAITEAQTEWIAIGMQAVAVLDGLIDTLDLWGVKLPKSVSFAWEVITGLVGRSPDPFEFSYDDLNQSICVDYLPGR